MVPFGENICIGKIIAYTGFGTICGFRNPLEVLECSLLWRRGDIPARIVKNTSICVDHIFPAQVNTFSVKPTPGLSLL